MKRHMAKHFGLVALVMSVTACQEPPAFMQKQTPHVKIGKPYVINGKTYYPEYNPSYDKIGEASWYGPGFHGKYTANGEVFDQNDLTAAHPTLPMPSLVRVTNLSNDKSLIVRINDRGPFKDNRIIDLSKGSAQHLGIRGVQKVRVQFLKDETTEYMTRMGSDHSVDMAALNQRINNAQIAAASTVQTAAVENKSLTASPASPAYQPSRWVGSAQAGEPIPIRQPYSPPPVVEASATKVASVSPASGNALVVQAGSFSTEQNAKRLGDKLANFADVSIDKVLVGERVWYRVRLGPFGDKQTAQSVLGKVHASGVPNARILSGS